MTKRIFFIGLMLILYQELMLAQAYRMELGIMGGGATYIGDANTGLVNHIEPTISLLGRYNLGSRFALKADLGLSKLSGSTVGKSDNYPNGVEFDFENPIVDGSLQFEFNFYEFGAPAYIQGASNISPYIGAGIGLIGYEAEDYKLTAELPICVGLKYKLPNRFNIGVELSWRMSFTDKLDYSKDAGSFQLNDPWLASSSWNKNKDSYLAVKIYISYDLFYNGSSCYKE